MKISKRDGTIVEFEWKKIATAISKANDAAPADDKISEDEIQRITDIVVKLCGACDHIPTVEEVQNMVVDNLALANHCPLMRLYSEYRFKRALVRKKNTTDDSIMKLVHNNNRDLAEENANKSTVLNSTQRDYMAGEVSRDITRRITLPEDITRAHDDAVIHFHDMDYFIQPMKNCCLVNIGDMLDNGTVMNDKLIESPHRLQVAATIFTQIIAAIASNQYGGQSLDMRHLGKYLRRSKERFERKIFKKYGNSISDELRQQMIDDLVKDELSASIQTIQYQINTLMTTNGQSPFVTLFLYLRPDDPYIEENAAIIEEVLKQRIQGIKNEAGVYITPAFPKLVYVLDEHNNLTGGKYDYLTELAIQCTAKRMYPDYISAKKMRENYQGNVFSPMGCRSFLAPWKNEKGEYQFEGRFNQGVVSINLPQIGIIANGDEEKFWKLMDERLDICFRALMCRHEHCKEIITDNSPLHWQYGAISRLPAHTDITDLLYGGYSSISLGYIGLYECTKAMKGVSHTDPVGFEFAMRVMKRLRKACDDWKAETNIGFALYGTPAESLCYRFCKIDREKFGVIPDITDKGYYTNSYHVDVREHIDAFDKLKFENQFQPISSGGCISYVEIPNMQKNLDALRTMVKFIYDNIQYAEFNTKSDYCQVCGFDGEITLNDDNEWECPCCHNKDHDKLNIVRRTCGYLGEKFWNVGKTKEIKSRVIHVS
ncbi:MAG: anaerobic ribonucleoside-triphosphate reductase [Lachnospiraceae bacterium]|nr:anaerobic ribonucleoside-triphosphate reductase [Lachnospiraceae bacterium]